ncbi:MAG: NUDIX domain-containing protein [Alphaproteobacteria bacterium]|nr:NUDIX domain-containing protein [Alphaproteobacteria bacterium]
MPDPVTPRPAATLLLLRDGAAGLEVLMTARHEASGFAAGALVFPGGKLEAEDLALRPSCTGGDGLDDTALGFRIAAIRETFEETGILLARRPGASTLLTAAELATLRQRHPASGFAAVVAAAGLQLATDALVPYAHWITPVDRPKRFDTHFFVAPAPVDQVAVHDGHEAVEVVWAKPAETVEAGDRERVKLVFATRMNLVKLAASRTVAEALAAARRDKIVTVCPEIVKTPEGPAIRIPEAAGYGLTQMLVGAMPRA